MGNDHISLCRTKWSQIKNDLHDYDSNITKEDRDFKIFHDKSDANRCSFTEIYHQLLHVFHHRFGERCLWNAISNLVWRKWIGICLIGGFKNINLSFSFYAGWQVAVRLAKSNWLCDFLHSTAHSNNQHVYLHFLFCIFLHWINVATDFAG